MTAYQISLSAARSFLFVPASRPERIAKAIATGVDAVIVDLEDAVAPTNKLQARSDLIAWLGAHPEQSIVVRINAADTEWYEDDLDVCLHSGVVGVMLPKAETHDAMAHVHAVCNKPVFPIIETVAGLDALDEIASTVGCLRLVFGKLDLAVELDLIPDEVDPLELVFLVYRTMLVMASRRAGLPAPIDGVFTTIDDADTLAAYAKRARNNGFGGQLLIHPKQVLVATRAFTPSSADMEWAKAILLAEQAAGGGVAVVDGRMVDTPVIARAQRIIEKAQSLGIAAI